MGPMRPQQISVQYETDNPFSASSTMKTLIKNAQVVLPTGIESVSVLLENGKIAAIDPASQTAAEETVDAAGLYLLPGVVDDQVHFREPGLTQRRFGRGESRLCKRRSDDFSGNAKHRAKRNDPSIA